MFDEGFWINAVIIGVFVIMGVILVIALREILGMLKTGRQQNQVRVRGASTSATILKVWQTGRAVGEDNPNPKLSMVLQVQPADQPSFQAEATTFVQVWDVPAWQPGAQVEVKYDPNDTRKIAVERLTAGVTQVALDDIAKLLANKRESSGN